MYTRKSYYISLDFELLFGGAYGVVTQHSVQVTQNCWFVLHHHRGVFAYALVSERGVNN